MTVTDPPLLVPPIINGWQAMVILMPGVLAFLTSTVAVIIGYLARQDVKELHMVVNSRLTQLLESTGAQRFAEGQIEGKAAGRVIQKAEEAEMRTLRHAPDPTNAEPTNAGPTDRPAIVVTQQEANTAALLANTAATDANTEAGAKGRP